VPVSTRHCDRRIVLNGVGYNKKPRAFDLGRIMAASPMRFALPQKTKADSGQAPAMTIADRVNGACVFKTDGYAQRYL